MDAHGPDRDDERAAETHSDGLPVVGLVGSAGAIPALAAFFRGLPPRPGVAFVVALHLAPDPGSTWPEVLQRFSPLPVVEAESHARLAADHVHVLAPSNTPRAPDGSLQPGDLFLRSLADTHGPRAVAIVLSGADSDGAAGIQRIRERGGLTLAQDPDEARHGNLPRAAIGTGMVDWVLPVAEMPARVLAYIDLESRLLLPPEQVPVPPDGEAAAGNEAALREVLNVLRTRTGRDFGDYKRTVLLRRIGRRMQVNGVQDLVAYLDCLRTHPGEADALLRDLLISVTNFFRDPDCFAALEEQVPQLFRDKAPNGSVRAWAAACATGEEAYSIAILLAEHARRLDSPPTVQVFATDLDEEAIAVAREGVYPLTIAADVSEERLRTFFTREHRGYRVRRELREMLLFAAHDLLRDPPFSRLDLMSCRNLLIHLNREAQQRVFETAHFALQPQGRLFLGASETAEEDSPRFLALDRKHGLYGPRPMSGALVRAAPRHEAPGALPIVGSGDNVRTVSWTEMHLKLLERLAPPSVLVDAGQNIVHLSPNAGRLLQFGGGEPSLKLLYAIHPALRSGLRDALHRAALGEERIDIGPLVVDLGGEALSVRIGVQPMRELAPGMTLVLLASAAAGAGSADAPRSRAVEAGEPLSHHVDRELERLTSHLRDTVEQYAASTEELQSINEELTSVNQELKRKVDELGHANSDMQNLMDATAIATVFLDRELRITRYTPSAVGLFNLIPTDIGRPLSHLTNHLNYPGLAEDARCVLQGLVPVEREVHDAHGNWYLVRTLPYRTLEDRIAGVVLTLVDITERKSGREALRSSQELLRRVVDSAVEYAIFSMDLERRVTSWNAGAQRLLGFAQDEILGRSADVIFTDEDRAAGAPARETAIALAEGRALDERLHQRKDGERFWASGVMMPMRDANGEATGFVKVLRDQTAERATRDALAEGRLELLRALEEKEQARLELEAADQAKDRFLAVLSHELRNPLAAISGASDALAAAAPADGAPQRAVRILQQQVGTMRTLLDDLLDVSRLRLGRFAIAPRRVALRSVVDAAVETVRPLIERRGHALAIELPERPIALDVDPARISQVLSNLLVNAAKYTDEGGRIGLAARTEGGQLVLTVSDNGQGLDEKTLASMFEMFWQSADLEQRAGYGMGIGLSLVRSIVQMHNGTVEAHSEGKGRGSRFVVRLPLAATGDDLPPGDETPAAGDEAPAGPPLRIVLADDNEDAAWSLVTLLSSFGHAVTSVTDGEAAWEQISTLRPDVALLDIAMPGIDGYEVARRVRAEPWGRSMLLIAATGWAAATDRQTSSAAGFDAHLVKPIELNRLKELIARWPRRQ